MNRIKRVPDCFPILKRTSPFEVQQKRTKKGYLRSWGTPKTGTWVALAHAEKLKPVFSNVFKKLWGGHSGNIFFLTWNLKPLFHMVSLAQEGSVISASMHGCCVMPSDLLNLENLQGGGEQFLWKTTDFKRTCWFWLWCHHAKTRTATVTTKVGPFLTRKIRESNV